ncbi:hypothetical protein COW36_00450 [bacterium (Candidatus Blackallbacteria) CG17_big_fil_post_rev_8_21_14_2_50_48_46]|uniref:DUF721 domain-containing protein n=1 Tax=bacterium (Candidatus Blackallbacteria) CG17_big_fil_post_rev_8_21_14_2_50_48_46 TaxID=2014261 RepID=A0A2M7GBM6_9BACT|nr:MAG: hypothetical protein COW64_10720 [bacterium (Candidatus Blackallbacteria) CG18_big_fil_WC_8_21_14_2_50_49_26]PIW19343.1 MAG: hypothetical protein COW36_00450 [bacterium (Candidatus Blackallbacteria) CG17_big_fil_post_rev_8_21_14_2_50_48_46]PIW49053.1 MAG: hypothetical protein COW20_08005 [bacterium (Candidatus Blackallbacteria) CG13_big_fil_rev_8_21_14_2_50_49_14]
MKQKKNTRRSGLQPMSYLLSSYMHQLKDLKQDRLGLILERWVDIVGPFISERMEPIRIEEDRLICYVVSSSLLHEFSFLETDILRKLVNYPCGEGIKGIRLTTVKPPSKHKPPEKRQKTQPIQLPPEKLNLREIHALEESVQIIKDQDTQARVLRLLKAMETRKKTLAFHHWKYCAHCQNYCEPRYKVCPICNQSLRSGS